MPTFRHVVAVGVGAAIALSCIESDASKQFPLLPVSAQKPVESPKSQLAVAPAQGDLAKSLLTPQKAESHVSPGQTPVPVIGASGSALSNVPVLAPLPVAELPVKKDRLSQSTVAVVKATVKDVKGVNPQSSRKTGVDPGRLPAPVSNSGDSVVVTVGNTLLDKGDWGLGFSTNQVERLYPVQGNLLSQSPTAVNPLLNLPKSTQDYTRQPILSPVAINTITPLTSLASPDASTRLLTNHESPRNLIFSLSGMSGAPSLASGIPTPTQVAQNTPVPEFLNPSPNPLSFPTRSQEVQVQTLQPITLQQAIELARRNNRDLQTAQLNLVRARYGLQAALATEFPTASVTADFTRSDSSRNSSLNSTLLNQLSGSTGALQGSSLNAVSTAFSTGLQVSYDLYTSGLRPAQIRSAERQIRFQELQVENTDQQLRLDVTTAYYNLQQADAQVEISRAAVADATQSLRDAVLREQAGLGTRFDVLQAQVSLSNANQSLTTALSQQRISRRQIVQLLGLSQEVEVSAADPIAVAGQWNISLEQSIVLAYKNRAELEQPLLQREINEQQRIIALAAVKPQVSLTASYNITGLLNSDTDPTHNFSLGAGLRWNFFDAGAARARANQSKTDIAIAETNFSNVRDQIRFQIEQAFFNLNSSAQNIQTASFALVQAQESLRLARLRFEAGVGTQTDVINQQTALTNARGSRITAILDYNRSLATLQRSVSNLPNSNLSTLP